MRVGKLGQSYYTAAIAGAWSVLVRACRSISTSRIAAAS